MRYGFAIELLLFCSVAFGAEKPASCELTKASIVSRSSSGLAQVSNIGDIEVRCEVAARPFPTKEGEGRKGLGVATTAYLISADGSKTPIASQTKVHAGGGPPFGLDNSTGTFVNGAGPEFIVFYLHVPIEPAERKQEARRYVTNLFSSLSAEKRAEWEKYRALEWPDEFVYQNRLGHLQVDCHVLDDDRIMETGVIEFEVLFKGRFSDFGLRAIPPA